VYQLGGLTTAQEMHDAYEQFHNYKAFLDAGMIVNDDGMVRAFSFFLSHIYITNALLYLLFAPIY
jgi:hypothetical protein